MEEEINQQTRKETKKKSKIPINKIIIITLIIIFSLVLRLHNNHQTDFDSYWISGQAESIQIHGSALWVFHPTSLFGYYPLSYPSGTMFFLATASTLTGIPMNETVMLTSLIVGLLIVILTIVVAKKITRSDYTSYIAGMLVAVSPTLVNYTSFNTGGRTLVYLFVLSMIWSMFKWKESKKNKYLFLSIILFIFAMLVHRTAQLSIVYVAAFILIFFKEKIPIVWNKITKKKLFKKLFLNRYTKNKKHLLIDIAIILITLFIYRVLRSLLAGRLANSILGRITKITNIATPIINDHTLASIIGMTVIFIGVITIIIYELRTKKIRKITKKHTEKHLEKLFEKPEKYFSTLIGLITLFLFIGQFLGRSFYSPSLNDYYQSTLISGHNPFVAFINFFINYSTSITPLFFLYFIGFFLLIIKKEKSFGEWFMIMSFMLYSGLLLDKRYTRIFLIPFVSIVISWTIMHITKKIIGMRKKHLGKLLSFSFVLLILFMMLLNIFLPYMRGIVETEERSFDQVKPYWEAGQYLRGLDCDCSTLTTKELVAGVTIFASSGLPGGSHSVYYFIDEEKLKPTEESIGSIFNKIISGEKIENLWRLEDWVLGGTYYIGRHAGYIFGRPYNDKIVAQLIEEYKIYYYNHDKELKPNKFFESIKEIDNKIYDNPKLEIYDLKRGRAS